MNHTNLWKLTIQPQQSKPQQNHVHIEWDILPQVSRTPYSLSLRHWSNNLASDRCLNDVEGLYYKDYIPAGRVPLHCAARAGSGEICEKLINVHNDCATKDNDCLIPLHHACLGGHIECCKLLLNNMSPANAPDKVQWYISKMKNKKHNEYMNE